jgi:phosphoserine aminotransferase
MTEAKKAGYEVLEAASSSDTNFNYIPKNLKVDSNSDYLHYTSNNTIFGTQFKGIPQSSLPLVCDMSSDIFSKEINVADFDLIYAGAQKNMGPAGTTLYIVKDEVLGKSTSSFMPTYLDLKTHAEKESMFNTPPVFPVYASMLNLRSLMSNGGVPGAQERNEAKASLLYNEIDSNPLFEGTVAKEDRSNMNVTFLMKDDSRLDEFNALWQKNDLVGLKGHRSVGGFRASMYNALPIESVKVLVDLMKHFSSKG